MASVALQAQEAQQPLLSAKLHTGWISDVHLLPSTPDSPGGRLLTASNDASCMLWDLGRVEGSKPVCLHAARELHTGEKPLRGFPLPWHWATNARCMLWHSGRVQGSRPSAHHQPA